jgi:hypothetical protein
MQGDEAEQRETVEILRRSLVKIGPLPLSYSHERDRPADAGPLGMVTNPKSSPDNEACKNRLATLAYEGIEVVIP